MKSRDKNWECAPSVGQRKFAQTYKFWVGTESKHSGVEVPLYCAVEGCPKVDE